jgi:hypothetical protein
MVGFDEKKNKKTRPEDRVFLYRRLERAMRFELTTLTLARLCSTPELRPHRCRERDLQTIPAHRKGEMRIGC